MSVELVRSLPRRHIDTLLRTLARHRNLLMTGHTDAVRLLRHGRRPAYLVDFELVYRYMFEAREHPEWVQELEYLFGRRDTPLILGPGTALEVDRFLDRHGRKRRFQEELESVVGAVAGHAGSGDWRPSFRKKRSGDDDAPGAYVAIEESSALEADFAIARLERLLNSRQFLLYPSIVPGAKVDLEMYNIVRAALDRARRGAAHANTADALNIAAVAQLRDSIDELGYHPYLLSTTRQLFDERRWVPAEAADESPLTRTPYDAIYVEVMLTAFPDPQHAARHTNQMAYEAAKLEKELRMSPAYLEPDDFVTEPVWEEAVERKLFSPEFREQLEGLAKFVTDPIVVEAQRIYENAQLVVANQERERVSALRELEESPRRLFDLIASIEAALSFNEDGATGLEDLWIDLFEVRETRLAEHSTYELADRSATGHAAWYLTIERHVIEDDPDSALHIIRWPASRETEIVLSSFSAALEAAGVKTAIVHSGSGAAISETVATIPLTWDEFGFAEQQTPPEWLRVDSEPLDLYCDLTTHGLRDPLVGVFASNPDLEQVARLYSETSARYLFPGWLRSALTAIAEGNAG